MTLPNHDAAHCDKAQSANAKFLSSKDRGDDNVAACLQPTVGSQFNPVAKAVESENLVGFGQAHFPRRTSIFYAGLRRSTGAADIARNQNDIGVCLGDASGNRSDASRAHKLHTNPSARIDLLQVVNELSQILD